MNFRSVSQFVVLVGFIVCLGSTLYVFSQGYKFNPAFFGFGVSQEYEVKTQNYLSTPYLADPNVLEEVQELEIVRVQDKNIS